MCLVCGILAVKPPLAGAQALPWLDPDNFAEGLVWEGGVGLKKAVLL